MDGRVLGVAAIAAVCGVACSLLVDTSDLASGHTSGPDGGQTSDATGGSVVDVVSDVATDGAGDADVTVLPDADTDAQPTTTQGPISTGQKQNASVLCKGGAGTCPVPSTPCCVIFGSPTDFCVAAATAVADCHSSAPTSVARCEEESDCPTGELCCAVLGNAQRPFTETKCASSCGAGEVAMCRNGGGACPAGKTCQHLKDLDAFNPGYGWRACQ